MKAMDETKDPARICANKFRRVAALADTLGGLRAKLAYVRSLLESVTGTSPEGRVVLLYDDGNKKSRYDIYSHERDRWSDLGAVDLGDAADVLRAHEAALRVQIEKAEQDLRDAGVTDI